MRRTLLVAAALLLIAASAAQAAPELSVSERLQDRRYGVAGERARLIGFEDGRFYANGWHITGEMGGLWTEPLKLVDGVWFGSRRSNGLGQPPASRAGGDTPSSICPPPGG